MSDLFQRGDRVFNTGNTSRRTIGIITKVIDADWCEVLWSDGEGYTCDGIIRRDGTVIYSRDDHDDRIVKVKLSVRVPTQT